MKYLSLFGLSILPLLSIAQNNDEFRAALVSELRQLNDQEEIIVEYKKTGDWGDYEGGYLSFKLVKKDIKITLTNTNQYNKPSDTTTTARTLKDLIHKLNIAQDEVQDPDNVVISNHIHYNITKNGRSLARITSILSPDQVINKVELNPAFSEFFKKGQNKKAGILINNVQ